MSFYNILKTLERCEKDFYKQNSVNQYFPQPKIKVTSPEQFVPIHLALDYFPNKSVLEKYESFLNNKPSKSKIQQDKITQAFVNTWFKQVNKPVLANYQEQIVTQNLAFTDNSNVVFGKSLYRLNLRDNWLSKLGLFVRITTEYSETMSTKSFNSVGNSYWYYSQIQYLVVVKAKVLPVVATAILLNQPLKLATTDIKVFYNPDSGQVETSRKIKAIFPELKKQEIDVTYTTHEEMMKYLVGEPEEKTNEQLLEGARKIMEEELVFV